MNKLLLAGDIKVMEEVYLAELTSLAQLKRSDNLDLAVKRNFLENVVIVVLSGWILTMTAQCQVYLGDPVFGIFLTVVEWHLCLNSASLVINTSGKVLHSTVTFGEMHCISHYCHVRTLSTHELVRLMTISNCNNEGHLIRAVSLEVAMEDLVKAALE
jgi:hypothetical protein